MGSQNNTKTRLAWDKESWDKKNDLYYMKRYKITTVPSWQKPKTKLGQVQIESRLIQDPSGQPPKTIMSIYRASNFIRREIRTQRSRMRKMRRSFSDIG